MEPTNTAVRAGPARGHAPTGMTAERTDAELIEDALRGERDAFAILVARHQSVVCAVAYAATGDVGVSEEVAQETFVAAWRQLGEIRAPERFRGWLCATCRNLGRMARRRRWREVPEADAPATAAMDASDQPTALEGILSAEQRALVWTALEAVPERYREPLVLFYREGRSVKQVAAGLGISEDAAKQRLSRGRQQLKEGVVALVEQTLARTGPGVAFGAAVTASIAGVTPTASADAPNPGPSAAHAAGSQGVGLSSAAIGAAALVVACGLGLAATRFAERRGDGAGAPTAETAIEPRDLGRSAPTRGAPGEREGDARGPRARTRTRAPLTPPARDALAEALAAARASAEARSAPASPLGGGAVGSPSAPRSLSLANKTGVEAEWQTRQMQTLNELLDECYELASFEAPGLAGTLDVRFSMTGEPDIGGLLEDIELVEEGSTIQDPTMRECVRESLYALELDPPPEGTTIARELTLRFDPE